MIKKHTTHHSHHAKEDKEEPKHKVVHHAHKEKEHAEPEAPPKAEEAPVAEVKVEEKKSLNITKEELKDLNIPGEDNALSSYARGINKLIHDKVKALPKVRYGNNNKWYQDANPGTGDRVGYVVEEMPG